MHAVFLLKDIYNISGEIRGACIKLLLSSYKGFMPLYHQKCSSFFAVEGDNNSMNEVGKMQGVETTGIGTAV
ncbi:hypothetical protein KDH_31230 [Dictyobacter sp. S3.2.2.5]|uniref:Uncharacterized protein n=1 Tax=Dictyobacter halimunensis TaxID=3026934 RepID=A0ABQ6FPY4_9CHLR|nr:hypothetical protein KDH_31230 [Dictyobacter sp. S3.2.2.5]